MADKARNLNCYQKFTFSVVHFTEYFFYRLGYNVGLHPKRTITICWVVVLLSALGFFRFHQEKNPMKLWVPPNSQFIKDTDWLLRSYQMGFRLQAVILQSDDVLTPSAFQDLLALHLQVKDIHKEGITWNDVCFKIPKVDKGMLRLLEGDSKADNDLSTRMNAALYCSFVDNMQNECFEKSILELWDFDEIIISQLTKESILERINFYDKNDILNRLKDYEQLLGGIRRNDTGYIIAAESIHNQWMVKVNFSEVDMDISGNNAGTADWASEDALIWESGFLDVLQKFESNFTIHYAASRSFGDISNATMFQDIGKLCIGIFIMVIYVQFVISKFNWLEARVMLGSAGLLSVGMAFIVGCGLCSLVGVSYGPVHTSLPFLLMGLGIDDMFVIVACFYDLSDAQQKLPIPDRIGLILKHAGVSITVTSVTDVLAFVIGSSTILPSLQSYCIYAAVAVLMTFIFAVTFFMACFVLDLRRIQDNRNGILICMKHTNYKVNQCSQKQTSNRVFEIIYNNVILTTPGKICVIALTLISLGFSLESAVKLEQRFDPSWFIPDSYYLADYFKARDLYFPGNGFEAGIYMGSLNYTHELIHIQNIAERLQNEDSIAFDVVSWVDPFRDFVLRNFYTDVYMEALSEEYFQLYLSMFLFNPRTALYQANFRFEKPLECGVPAPKIIMSSVDFNFRHFSGPEEHLPAMHKVQEIAFSANITTGDKFVTAWSKVFATWITDEVIEIEVIRNLEYVLLCVMGCTVLLIADLQTCFWIFICVLLTMVNVCGFMQRWGLTIDLVSCIGLELAIGLCVDYASHIGHTFLTVTEGSRRHRSLKTVTTIGSAVFYGGLSTLIGVFMLSQSDAYSFQAFFKIFVLVIFFGLFHGVVLLPVIFSWIGPRPYNIGIVVQESDVEIK